MAATESTRDIVLRMDGKLDDLIKKVSQHDCDLNGNGKAGLKSDVRKMADEIIEIKSQHTAEKQANAARKEKIGARGWQVALLAIGQLVTLAVAALK